MDLQDKINHYKEHFKKDALLKKIQNLRLEETLFEEDEYFTMVMFAETYSSKQAAELLNIEGKEQTLVNYISRNDLKSYLSILRQSRFYRYDWESLFKFKMILLLNQNGLSPMDIANLAGTRIETASSEAEEYTQRTDTNNFKTKEDMYKIAEEISYKNIGELIQRLTVLDKYKEQKALLESTADTYTNDIKSIDIESKYIKDRLEDLDRYLEFCNIIQEQDLGKQSNGLFSRFFQKKEQTSDSKIEVIQERIHSTEQKKIELEKSLELLRIRKETIDINLKNTIAEIDAFKPVTLPINEKEGMIGHEILDDKFVD